jgi:regulatory protein
MAFRSGSWQKQKRAAPSVQEARLLLEGWCARAERSPRQVRDKLQRLNVQQDEWEEHLEYLRTEGYQDDGRFARAYVRDHLFLQHWGPVKIRYGLRMEAIEEAVSGEALAAIAAEDWLAALEKLLRQRLGEPPFPRLAAEEYGALSRFILQRGFTSQQLKAVLEGGR